MDFLEMPWVDLLGSMLPSLIEWDAGGCKQDVEVSNSFTDLLVNGLQPVPRTTVVVEDGVGISEIALRSIGGSALTSLGQQGRIILYAAARRLRQLGRGRAPKPEPCANSGGAAASAVSGSQTDNSLQTYEAKSQSKVTHMYTLLETHSYVGDMPATYARAKEKSKLRTELAIRSRKDKDIVSQVVTSDFERAAREAKEDTFEAQVTAAAESITASSITPRAFHLLNVEPHTRQYLKGDMAITLAVLRQRKDPDNVALLPLSASLKKKPKDVLRRLLTDELFGPEWVTRFLPMNMRAVRQAEAVAEAKAMSTPEMIADGSAWAWKP